MKRFHILISGVLFLTFACSVTSTESPPQTSLPPVAASSTPLPTDEPAATQFPAENEVTDPPLAPVPTFPVPQPSVAHHRPGDTIVLDSIKMVDALIGWATSGGDVLSTSDGAKTWREVTPPEVLPPGSQVQAQGGFLDTQYAWIVFSIDNQIPTSAVVWSTSDFGYTWVPSAPLEHQAFGDQVWAEGFALDTGHLWLMVRGVYLGAGTHYDAQLLRSASSGHVWQPLTGNESFDYNYDYTGLVFADPDNGLVTWQTTGAYAPGPPEYAVTSDGGSNWKVRQLPPPADAPDLFESFDYCEPFQPRMFSNQSIRLLMGCFDVYDPPQKFSSYLYFSEDGGSTWTSTRLPEEVLANQAALLFFDKDNALLLGRDIYRSANGGQSWDYVKSVIWNGQFSFVDPQTGWAIARADDETALVKTSNGGTTWIEIKPVIAP